MPTSQLANAAIALSSSSTSYFDTRAFTSEAVFEALPVAMNAKKGTEAIIPI